MDRTKVFVSQMGFHLAANAQKQMVKQLYVNFQFRLFKAFDNNFNFFLQMNQISRSNFIRRKLKTHIRYTRLFFPLTHSFSKIARSFYKKLFFKYRKFRSSRRKKRFIRHFRYIYLKRFYNFLFYKSNLRESTHKHYLLRVHIYPSRFSFFSRIPSYSTSISWKIFHKFIFLNIFKNHFFRRFPASITFRRKRAFKRYRISVFRRKKRKQRHLRRFKKRFKRFLFRFSKRNRVFFRKRKLRGKKIRYNRYRIIKKHSSIITSKRFVRSVRYGIIKTLKNAKGLRNILAVRIIKTYNNFFIALQTSLGQNVFTYSTGRVDLRRNRRLTKQALEIASRNFSLMLRRRKFYYLNFTIVGRMTYHSRIFMRALKLHGIKIRAIRFILRRAHNGLRARSSRRV